MSIRLFIGLLCLQFLLPGCSKKTNTRISQTADNDCSVPTDIVRITYDFSNPDTSFVLDEKLLEVSGLSFNEDGQLLAIQDEDGILFTLDPESGAILEEAPFYKPGDYEGVEYTPGHTYVIKSSGSLLKISNDTSKPAKVEKNKYCLTKKYDVEGLALDAKNDRLLIACKGIAGEGAPYEMRKGIYQYGFKKQTIDTLPVFLLNIESFQHFIKHKIPDEQQENFDKFFDQTQTELPFCPSAIAIHPLTGNIYICSSVGKRLAVINEKGDLLRLIKFDKKIHRQPEGIAFDKDGRLFIANEGKKSKNIPPKLVRYDFTYESETSN